MRSGTELSQILRIFPTYSFKFVITLYSDLVLELLVMHHFTLANIGLKINENLSKEKGDTKWTSN